MEYENITSIIILLEHYIVSGNMVKVWQLFQLKDFDVKIVNENGDTLLHLILRSRKFSVYQAIALLDFLISRGADVNAKNKNEETLLHLAIEEQLKDVIEYLLKKGAKINVANRRGHSLTHFFVKDASVKFVELQDFHRDSSIELEPKNILEQKYASFAEWLLLKGFDFHQKNNKGHCAIRWAITFNLHHILVPLFKYIEDIYLHCVTKYTKRTLLHLFLDANNEAKRSGQSFRSLHPKTIKALDVIPKIHPDEFSQRYDIQIVKILIKRGVTIDHVNRSGLTALKLAIKLAEKIEIVEILLKRTSKLEVEYGQILIRTVIKNAIEDYSNSDYYYKLLTKMLSKGFEINRKDKNGETAVFYAARFKNFRVIDFLRKFNADFSVITNSGENMFHALAKKSPASIPIIPSRYSLNLTKLFKDEGCDINAKDNEGRTPLNWVMQSSDITIIQHFIDNGADVKCQAPKTGWGLLHMAICQQSLEIVELLLTEGADINGPSSQGRPLHVAIEKIPRSNFVEVLLKLKAEVNARNYEGESVLFKALVNNESDFVQQLLVHGADVNDIDIDIVIIENFYPNHTTEILLKHCIKLEAANLPISKEYKTYVQGEEYQNFYEECLREVEELKKTWIDKHMSIYKWLHIDPNRRHIHSHSDRLQILVDSPTLKEIFPRYSTVIMGSYNEAFARKALLDAAMEGWLKLTNFYLPDVCVERILSHLNTGYLLELTELVDESN